MESSREVWRPWLPVSPARHAAQKPVPDKGEKQGNKKQTHADEAEEGVNESGWERAEERYAHSHRCSVLWRQTWIGSVRGAAA